MLHERADMGAAAVARAVVFGVWLILVATTPMHLLAVFPEAAFRPVGVLSLLPSAFWDGVLTPAALTTFRLTLAALLLLVVLGRGGGRPLAIAAAVGVLLFDGVLKSHGGYINHSRFALLYAAIVLGLTVPKVERTTGDPGAVAGPRPDPGAALRLAALMMAATYALIGVHRILVGGIGIFLDDSLATYIMLRTFEPARYTFELGYAAVGSAAVLAAMKVGFLITTLAEIASPFAVFHRRLRQAWIAVIVPFHMTTLLTMNIFFWENLILIGLLFTDLPTRIDEWRQGRESSAPRIEPDERESASLSVARTHP